MLRLMQTVNVGRFGTPCHFHNAEHIVGLTTSDLDLNRSVRDPKLVLQLLGDGA